MLVLLVVPALLVGGSSPPPPGMKTRPSTWWEVGGSKSELQQTGLQGQETLMQPMKLDRESKATAQPRRILMVKKVLFISLNYGPSLYFHLKLENWVF